LSTASGVIHNLSFWVSDRGGARQGCLMRAKDAVGKYGERVAARHLMDSGLHLLATNWRCPEGEVDIIARDGNVLVFCEVKTRSSTAYGDPAEAVSPDKASRIRGLALLWLAEQRDGESSTFWPELRFDVVSVIRQPQGSATVRHLRAAF
jgi:putative endonuclease